MGIEIIIFKYSLYLVLCIIGMILGSAVENMKEEDYFSKKVSILDIFLFIIFFPITITILLIFGLDIIIEKTIDKIKNNKIFKFLTKDRFKVGKEREKDEI